MWWPPIVTHIRAHEGALYLAVSLDHCSHPVIGWSMGGRIDTDLVLAALLMAIWRGRPKTSVTSHADQDSQGGSNRALQHPQQGGVHGATCWMDEAIDRERRNALSWGSFAWARSSASVLGADRHRDHERAGGRCRWRVSGRERSLVPTP